MPCFPANILRKNSGERDKTTQPHCWWRCWRRHHHPPGQQLLSVTLQLQNGLFGFKKLCFSKDLPRQLSSPVLLLCLFADGVCLVDPEYLKDRKGIDTETQHEGRGWSHPKAQQHLGVRSG